MEDGETKILFIYLTSPSAVCDTRKLLISNTSVPSSLHQKFEFCNTDIASSAYAGP